MVVVGGVGVRAAGGVGGGGSGGGGGVVEGWGGRVEGEAFRGGDYARERAALLGEVVGREWFGGGGDGGEGRGVDHGVVVGFVFFFFVIVCWWW